MTDPVAIFEQALHGDTRPAGAEPIPLGEARERPEFPLDIFPDWIAEQVAQSAVEMQIAPDLPAQFAITTLSVALARRVKIKVDGPWVEKANTYLVTAMDSSDGKSPSMGHITKPLEDLQDELIESMQRKIGDVRVQRKILEKQQQSFISKGETAAAMAINDDLLELPEVYEPRLIVDDVTPEKLGEIMAQQGGRIAILSAEAGLFDMMAKGYKDSSDLDIYLKGWSGDTYSSDRISRTTGIVRDATITIGLCVQPSVIAQLADYPQFHGRGLLARLMFAMPPSRKGYRDRMRASTFDTTIDDTYRRNLDAIARPLVLGDPTARVLHLSAEALHLFRLMRQNHEDRMRPGGDLEHLAEWATKCQSTTARLAGILHVADGNEHDEISVGTMQRAMKATDYWIAHVKIASDLWGSDPVITAARKIVDWLAAENLAEFSVRDVYNAHRRLFPKASDSVAPLDLLTERGWVFPQFDGPLEVGKRGAPSPIFTVSDHIRHSASRNGEVANHANHALKGEKKSLSIYLSTESDSEGPTRTHGSHGSQLTTVSETSQTPF